MWVEISSSSERTTNACESFHNKYNLLLYTHHPDIFGNIKKNSNRHQNSSPNTSNGHTNNEKTKKNFMQQNFIHRRQPNQFKNNKISRLNFVKRMAFKYQTI